jgi:glycogen debranching enzyme
MKRYGYADEANRVTRAIFDAARAFLSYRLPELFAGLPRGDEGFPVQYLGANVPQAWAAGSIFMLVQTMLGLHADAPNGVLYVDPTLPAWLPELTLNNLQVGDARLDLYFQRNEHETLVDVLSGATSIRVERSAFQHGAGK